LGIDGNNLNNFIAGSTAELIDYAYTGDFTFNLLNAGIIPGLREMGLLELHLGDEGPFMKLGSDGVDVSMLGTQILNAGISSLIDVITGINRREEIIIERPVYPEEELEPVPDNEERVAALLERDEAETESVNETFELKEPELTESELEKQEAERLNNEKKRLEREMAEEEGKEQLKKVKELYEDAAKELGQWNQKTLGAIVGLEQNNTCLVYTLYLLYHLTAPASISRYSLLEGIRKAMENGSINNTKTDNNARVDDFYRFIETMTTVLFGDKAKEKWSYGKSLADATEFFNSNYEYGIMVYERIESWRSGDEERPKHFLLVDNKNNKIYDPWPGGIGSIWKADYFLKEIRSLIK
jgi:hypothetical protein